MRVLKWIFDRVHGRGHAIVSPLGWMPAFDDLDWQGLSDMTPKRFGELTRVDKEAWAQELRSQSEFFGKLGAHLPPIFSQIQAALTNHLAATGDA